MTNVRAAGTPGGAEAKRKELKLEFSEARLEKLTKSLEFFGGFLNHHPPLSSPCVPPAAAAQNPFISTGARCLQPEQDRRPYLSQRAPSLPCLPLT